ncbi:TRAP transporter substrate-binding protein [soil metagenome]
MKPTRLIATSLAVALIGLSAEARDLTSSDVFPSGYPTVEAVAHRGRLIEERSGGRHRIASLGAGDLDSENLTVGQVGNGRLDMARVNLAVLNNLVPSTVVLSLPFLFKSAQQMQRVLDGPVGEEILADMAGSGLIGLCFYDAGYRSYAANRPIRSVTDMKALKVRVQQADKWGEMLRAMGAQPVAMPNGQIIPALRNGVIDALETTLPNFAVYRQFEAAKFFSVTQQSMAPGVLVFSKRVWDEMTPQDRELIRTAAHDSVTVMRSLREQYEVDSRRLIEAAGGQIVENVDRKSFADLLLPLYPKLITDPRLQEMVKRIQATD